MPDMIKIDLKAVHYKENRGENFLTQSPIYDGRQIGSLKAVTDERDRVIHLNRLFVLSDYRGNGLAKVMLDRLVTWSQTEPATYILATTSQFVLENDTFEHFTNYMKKYGFKLNGNDLRLDK